MKKLCFYGLLMVCLLSSKVGAEELTWGSCTTYAPMPVLFIHGINANCKTWDSAIPKLKHYFGYREFKPFSKEKIVPDKLNYPPEAGITYFKDGKYESPAKLYLEAFDYGGKNKAGSAKPLKNNYENLDKKVIEVLQAYYGDKWQENKINIVAHSQGGLIGRYYLQQNLDAQKYVKRFIAVDSPFTGSSLASTMWGIIVGGPINAFFRKEGWMIPVGVHIGLSKINKYPQGLIAQQYWQIIKGEGAVYDLMPNSKFVKETNGTPTPARIEYICLVGHKDKNGVKGDTVVSPESQMSIYKGNQTINWDAIIHMPSVKHGEAPEQWDKILQALDGIPDKGTKTYDTPRITLGTFTINTGTYSLYSKVPANDFYVTGKIYDYLPGSCTVTVEIDRPENYATDKDGQIKDRLLIKPIDMNTESQEVATNTTTPTRLNAKFNFHPTNPLSVGNHTFRLTVRNPGSVTGTATTKDRGDWIPFEITELPTPEKILSKVAENFGKIEDMKAKMVCNRSIGTITYPVREEILMMKKPDKMKVISQVNNKTVIINGEKMYIMTPTVKTIEVDLLEEIGTSGVISKMNFYYNLSEFSEAHDVLIKECQHDNIFVLEITSKGEDKMWDCSKMIVHIDYIRGLDIKKEMYLDHEDLTPSISSEIIEYQLINGIWIPTKTVEKSFFVDGVIEEITTFTDIQVNTGIPDSEFKP